MRFRLVCMQAVVVASAGCSLLDSATFSCAEDGDCTIGYVCALDVCVRSCSADVECGQDAWCSGGGCVPGLRPSAAHPGDGGNVAADGGGDGGSNSDGGAPRDGGARRDGSVLLDAGTSDASPRDGGRLDAGSMDAGTADAGNVDAGNADAGAADAGRPDAGVDAGSCLDADGDRRGAGCMLGPDCNDGEPSAWAVVVGYADVDGDGVTAGGEVSLCGDGVLPTGFLATRSPQDDCAPDDASSFRNATFHVDADGDGFTTGPGVTLCAGSSTPTGYQGAASATPDCDDGERALHTQMQLFPDGDEDSFTLGTAVSVCTTGMIPAGYLAAPSATLDCDDSNGTVHLLLVGFADTDTDGVTVGPGVPVCTPGVLPAGWLGQGSPADDNCPSVSNPNQLDTDADRAGDACDADDDADGVSDVDENAGVSGWITNPLLADTDADGTLDGADQLPTRADCTVLLFRDTFDGTSTAWTVTSGTWNRTGGSYVTTTTSGAAQTWIGTRSWTDYTIIARMRADTNTNDPGIMFRATSVTSGANGGAYYYAAFRPASDAVIFGMMNGGWNQRISVTHTMNNGVFYELKVRAAGSDIRVFVDGTQVIQFTDTTYTQGGIGFRVWQSPATYDEVIACR